MAGVRRTLFGTTTCSPTPDTVMLQDGPEPFAVTVREVSGDERSAWWDRSVAVFSNYAEYQAKTERVIPVLVATRK